MSLPCKTAHHPRPRMKYLFLAIALCFLSPLAAQAGGEAQVLFNPVISADTTWQGEIIVEGVVAVGRTATLSIAPGTVIRFRRIDRNRDGIGDSELRVLGRIVAQGTAEKPIVFTSAEASPAPMDWSYVLIFSSGQKNHLAHCRFQYAFSGVQVHFSTALVEQCLFEHNKEGIRFGRAVLDIRDSVFTNNDIGVRFTRMEGPASITGNRVTKNRIGIFLVPSGQNIMDFFEPDRGDKVWNTGRLTVTGNDIYNNTWYNLNLGEKQFWDLDVAGNWWGTTDVVAIRQTLFDKSRDAALGNARIEPIASRPNRAETTNDDTP